MSVERMTWKLFYSGLICFAVANGLFTPPDARGGVYVVLGIMAVLGLFRVGYKLVKGDKHNGS